MMYECSPIKLVGLLARAAIIHHADAVGPGWTPYRVRYRVGRISKCSLGELLGRAAFMR